MTRTSIRRIPTAVLALVLAAGLLSGCARDAVPTAGSSSETYRVEHVMGSTDVPVDYQRVVVTFPAFIDSAVAVGVVPVAAPVSSFGTFPEYFDVSKSEIADLGAYDERLDLEAISNFDPDLILFASPAGSAPDPAQYEALSAIAPAVPIVTAEQNFRRVAEQIGIALNREEQMSAVAAEYDARAKRLGTALAAIPDAKLPVSQLRLYPGQARMMMEKTNAGRVMTDVGLTFEPPIEGAELTGGNAASGKFYYELSLELLPEAAGDVVFVYSTDGAGVLEEVQSLPIWQEIPAVQAGRVFSVDYESWMRGQGYRAATSILDDIARAYGVAEDAS
ncbi:ABC transporter substrate-binding protein [Leucobacter sp. wl10]|uniref:ABC transporter substrate-binding protein n=1 Tax=Leucobacter sp. wl10 TaxID=2304677 RepID=UPI000E5B29C2|nr:ABC transporter substrate-binding protein [Leucobacter sp. wl10]RGE20169.1 hypothetical protein D1J51_09595 [Leucobacter sp. wl10]